MQDLKVVSLFDGMAGLMQALKEMGIKPSQYFASEIDKYAMQIAKKNHPGIIHIGDVRNVLESCKEKIMNPFLLVWGSPCQDLSGAGKGAGLHGERSGLFYEAVKIKEAINPKYWIMENVASMKAKDRDIISGVLGVEPILINSALVSAQNRRRLYWTNIPGIYQPEDKEILLKDIALDDVVPVVLHNIYGGFKERNIRVSEDKSPTIRTACGGGHIPYFIKKDLILSQKALEYMDKKVADGRTHWDFSHHSDIRNDKSATIVANFFKGVPYNVFKDWDCIRKFHPVEVERLQTLPDGYSEGVSNTQRYKMLGNGFTVAVIKHILSFIPELEAK